MKSLVTKKSFQGKTIQSMDTRACNYITFFFTDGTSASLHTEYMGISGLYGIVSVKESKVKKKK